MTEKVLIKNAKAIVTCDSLDQVFYDSDILIEGPQVKKIGKELDANGAKIISGKDKFVYPGLINTHHHYFQSFIRNIQSVHISKLTLVEWLGSIYDIFKKVNSDVIYYASLTAMADLIKHGCTTSFDHQYCYTNISDKKLVDRQMEAASQLGMRFHVGRATNTLPKSKGSTIPDEMLETTDEFISDCERIIDLYHNPEPFSMSRVVVAPCQPMNSYLETFKEAIALARTKGVHLHTHLYEGEKSVMLDRWGKTSLEWCEEIGFLGPDVWLAHAWEIEPKEYMLLAKTETGIAHCPAPAILGGFPIIDIKAMQEAEILVSLGVDGAATNDGSNLLDSLRIGYLMQAFFSKKRGGSINPYDMLKVATVNGAKILGRDDLGSLEVGKGADLFLVDISGLEMAGALHDPKNFLASVGVSGQVWLTMINGRVVYENNELVGVNEYELAKKAEKVCTDVLRNEFKQYFY